jgi:2-dehydro-3-deoxygluconokinase
LDCGARVDVAFFFADGKKAHFEKEDEMMRFLSIGECMAELAPLQDAGQFQLGFAGDTFNTAWYLRALRPDIATSYFTRVGTDQMSTQMLEMMTGAGIGTRFIARDPARTLGLYLISLKDGERSFSYWRDRSAARQLADDLPALTQAFAAADTIYFSGITLAIVGTAGRENLLNALTAARTDGKTIVFDPNLRPRLWASNGDMTATIMQAAAVSDIILPSHDDEAASFGDADISATVARYADTGARTVVVKNGAGTIHYRHDGASGEVTPPAVSAIIDTTAAGDSFNAGFLAGMDDGASTADAIMAAARVAGQVIGRKGALVPLLLDDIMV